MHFIEKMCIVLILKMMTFPDESAEKIGSLNLHNLIELKKMSINKTLIFFL